MTAKLSDGWSDCTARMHDAIAGAVYRESIDHGELAQPRIAWIDAHGVWGLDDGDRDCEPPAEVRQWLEAQAAKRGEPDGVPS